MQPAIVFQCQHYVNHKKGLRISKSKKLRKWYIFKGNTCSMSVDFYSYHVLLILDFGSTTRDTFLLNSSHSTVDSLFNPLCPLPKSTFYFHQTCFAIPLSLLILCVSPSLGYIQGNYHLLYAKYTTSLILIFCSTHYFTCRGS